MRLCGNDTPLPLPWVKKYRKKKKQRIHFFFGDFYRSPNEQRQMKTNQSRTRAWRKSLILVRCVALGGGRIYIYIKRRFFFFLLPALNNRAKWVHVCAGYIVWHCFHCCVLRACPLKKRTKKRSREKIFLYAYKIQLTWKFDAILWVDPQIQKTIEALRIRK